jgi:hypothetical protein
MRACLGLLFGLALLALVAPGCGPALNEDDLGRVIYDVREMPGVDAPFRFPDVSQPSTPESETDTPEAGTDTPEAGTDTPEGETEPAGES